MVELEENKNYAEPVKNWFVAFFCKKCEKIIDFEETAQNLRVNGAFSITNQGLVDVQDMKEQYDLEENNYVHYRENGVVCRDVERIRAENLEKLKDKIVQEYL